MLLYAIISATYIGYLYLYVTHYWHSIDRDPPLQPT